MGAAVGSGIVARAAEQGGADFLLAINAGRMRSMGAASIACMLPIHDASQFTLQFATAEILPMTRLPVYVGINPWNLEKPPSALAEDVLAAGFTGAVNFPTAMHYSRGFRRVLDQAGLGTRAEISLLRAVEDAGGKTMFFCGSPQQARDGADAGLSALLFNFGWNLGGALGHRPRYSLEEAALQANEVSRYLKRHRPELKLFLEGGPIAAADDLGFVSQLADIDGYVGGSTIDRTPIETSIGDQIASYRLAMDAVKKPAPQDRVLHRMAAAEGLVGQSQAFQSTLLSLRRAANASAPIVIRVPRGGPRRSILRLFNRMLPKPLRGSIVDVSALPGPPAHQLFGETGNAGQLGQLRRPNTLVAVPDFDALPQTVQDRLASAVGRAAYAPLGSDQFKPIQARLLLITGPSFEGDIWDNAVLVDYPSVADRIEDLDLLLQSALAHIGAEDNVFRSLSPGVRQRLKSHPWNQNEIEVLGFAKELLKVAEDGSLTVAAAEDLLSPEPARSPGPRAPQSPREQLVEALSRHNFRRGETAKALHISRKTLYNRMKKYELL